MTKCGKLKNEYLLKRDAMAKICAGMNKTELVKSIAGGGGSGGGAESGGGGATPECINCGYRFECPGV